MFAEEGASVVIADLDEAADLKTAEQILTAISSPPARANHSTAAMSGLGQPPRMNS
jgi:ethanolamine utilization microcompartment shell protein EutL